MEKTCDDLSDAAVLGKFTDTSLWMDDHPADKRTFKSRIKKSGTDRKTSEDLVQLSRNRDRYDLCTFAVYDPFCIFECGETGLVTCGSSKGSRCKSDESILDGVFQTDTSGAFIRCDSDIYSFHGTVFYRRYPKLSGFYLGLIFVLMYLPIAVVIVFSFNESKLPVRFTGFSLKWYQELIHDDAMLEALGNSLFLGVISCFVSAVIGTLGAVGLSRIHWKTKGILEYISILPLMIPEIILGMVLMAFFYMMNLPFGMLTLLIGHTVFCVPYILMEVKARLAGMDPSLEEAARDLGAGPFRAFWDIILPLIMPAVMSGSLLAFAMSMDDVVISIFINGPRLATLPIKVYTQIKTGVTPEVNALCTIMLVFTVLILFVYTMIGKVTKGKNKNS